MTELLIVRHCESTGQDPEAPLSEVGLSQACVLADLLDRFPIDHVASSPFRRALQSIAPYAARRGLPIVEYPALRERVLSGRPLPDWLDHVARSFVDLDHAPPGGESGRRVAARAWTALDGMIAAGHRLPVVVSHGNLIAFALERVCPEVDFAFWQGMANPDVFRLTRCDAGRWSLERIEAAP